MSLWMFPTLTNQENWFNWMKKQLFEMQLWEIWVENLTTICVFTFPRVVHWPRHVVRPICPNTYTQQTVCILYLNTNTVDCVHCCSTNLWSDARREGKDKAGVATLASPVAGFLFLFTLYAIKLLIANFFIQLVDNSLQIKVLGKHSTPRSDLSPLMILFWS